MDNPFATNDPIIDDPDIFKEYFNDDEVDSWLQSSFTSSTQNCKPQTASCQKKRPSSEKESIISSSHLQLRGYSSSQSSSDGSSNPPKKPKLDSYIPDSCESGSSNEKSQTQILNTNDSLTFRSQISSKSPEELIRSEELDILIESQQQLNRTEILGSFKESQIEAIIPKKKSKILSIFRDTQTQEDSTGDNINNKTCNLIDIQTSKEQKQSSDFHLSQQSKIVFPSPNTTVNKSRKNLALEIFTSSHSGTSRSNKNNIHESQKPATCNSASSNNTNKRKIDFNSDPCSRGNEILRPKKTVNFAADVPDDTGSEKNPKRPCIFKPPGKCKQAVVRKFPGPAGLLPDDLTVTEEPNLIIIEDSQSDLNENNLQNVYSQATKNLYTSGAWQLMIDDLPADFELWDIETITSRGKELSKEHKKIPHFAAIIQSIDYRLSDPILKLKDISGSIEARISRNILKQYPNALSNQNVILLKDVMLRMSTNNSKKHFCIIISPKNLVSIYNENKRIVETELLDKITNEQFLPFEETDIPNL